MTFSEMNSLVSFKSNVFIDWLNVKANWSGTLDFFKLMKHIRDKGGVILRANIYLPEPDKAQISFYDAIKAAGFKHIYIKEKYGGSTNCDTRMVVDMVTQSHDVDVIYLLSNDADFIPAVSYLQSIGKRVLLIHGDNPSNDLRRTVDEWRHLGQLSLSKEDKE
jgi:uncharacterized LabA/DUF88 family protein